MTISDNIIRKFPPNFQNAGEQKNDNDKTTISIVAIESRAPLKMVFSLSARVRSKQGSTRAKRMYALIPFAPPGIRLPWPFGAWHKTELLLFRDTLQ